MLYARTDKDIYQKDEPIQVYYKVENTNDIDIYQLTINGYSNLSARVAISNGKNTYRKNAPQGFIYSYEAFKSKEIFDSWGDPETYVPNSEEPAHTSGQYTVMVTFPYTFVDEEKIEPQGKRWIDAYNDKKVELQFKITVSD